MPARQTHESLALIGRWRRHGSLSVRFRATSKNSESVSSEGDRFGSRVKSLAEIDGLAKSLNAASEGP